jgi:hypothetical protein
MVSEKMVEIVKRLVKLTQEGRLNWAEEPNSGSYAIAFANFSLSISSDFSGLGSREDSVVIRIYNAEGEVIEAVSDEEFPEDTFKREQKTPYRMLYELYQNARRNAIGIDTALDAILAELPEPYVPF